MSYQKVKKMGTYYLGHRKENMDLFISNEDIKTLNAFKSQVYQYPLICLASMTAMKFMMKYLPALGIFGNQISSDRKTKMKGKFYGKFFANQVIAITTLGTLLFYFVRYNFSKYYMYLKYENLVDAYLDARDSELLKSIAAKKADKAETEVAE